MGKDKCFPKILNEVPSPILPATLAYIYHFLFSSATMNELHLGIDGEGFVLSIVPAIEKSFGIHFEQNDFELARTYGELCAVVQSKLPLTASPTCTTQQAFYKLRLALSAQALGNKLKPNSLLVDVLPSQRAQGLVL